VLKQYIDIHKKYRNLFHHGTYVRLNFEKTQRNGYGSISKDLSAALFCIVQMETPGHNDSQVIRFCGLSPGKMYRIRLLKPIDNSIEKMLEQKQVWIKGFHLTGQVLMQSGISIFMPWPQTGVLIELTQIEESKIK
jgi:alpha-galactosidase